MSSKLNDATAPKLGHLQERTANIIPKNTMRLTLADKAAGNGERIVFEANRKKIILILEQNESPIAKRLREYAVSHSREGIKAFYRAEGQRLVDAKHKA